MTPLPFLWDILEPHKYEPTEMLILGRSSAQPLLWWLEYLVHEAKNSLFFHMLHPSCVYVVRKIRRKFDFIQERFSDIQDIHL